ncbi:MAG: aminotransferase class I/II-fold pyridoxal phosphate-dependent enzyme [Clostridia bacterium]
MIYFNCDYTEGAHPKIIELLAKSNMEQSIGYGNDEYCQKAKELIKNACEKDDIDVHFLVGGTQCNLTFIASALRPHQGVICAKTGHINAHETGAIEATGHKVIALESGSDGKICAEQIEICYKNHINDTSFEHIVQPKMVYISNSTENGSVYTKAELKSISDVCRKNDLILYLDGARLGYAMQSPKSDISLKDLCELCDAFYIGGTKVGAMFGEALILTKESLKSDFRYIIKQRGGMLAKGRLLGVQFVPLFTDNLYFEIAKKAVDQAIYIANELEKVGVEFVCEVESNQIFPIFSDKVAEKISEKYKLEHWERYDETHSVTRICTSWATKDENVELLLKDIKEIL